MTPVDSINRMLATHDMKKVKTLMFKPNGTLFTMKRSLFPLEPVWTIYHNFGLCYLSYTYNSLNMGFYTENYEEYIHVKSDASKIIKSINQILRRRS